MEILNQMKSIVEAFDAQLEKGELPAFLANRLGVRRLIEGHIFHDYPEIFLQSHGITHFTFPNGSLALSPGELLIVPQEIPHREQVQKTDGQFENVVITPASSYIQCHISHASPLGIPEIQHYEVYEKGEHVAIRQIIDLVVEKWKLSEPFGSSLRQGLLQSFLSLVGALLEGTEIQPDGNPIVREVKNIVMSRYHDSSLKVSQMAAILNCTPDYLSWLFHQETGLTLNRYINQLRLKRSADLLLNTDYSVSEIAWICGFGSPAYFSRVFSREFSQSPAKFRGSS